MTQREATIVRKGILNAGYKINVLYNGPTSVTVRLMKKSNKTWTPAFKASSEKSVLEKLAMMYPLTLSKRDRERLKKYKLKADERRERKKIEEQELEASVAELKKKKSTSSGELRELSAAR